MHVIRLHPKIRLLIFEKFMRRYIFADGEMIVWKRISWVQLSRKETCPFVDYVVKGL